jgi:CMP-N,N'-diacetyllegionaminic acid synthase
MSALRMCTICARGGSKTLPGKNVAMFAGKPLLSHSVEQARRSRLFDVIAVSSDDPDYLAIGHAAGADETVLRPAPLASDEAGKLPVIKHCVETVEVRRGQQFEVVVDLQVTSPLRTPQDIAAAVALLDSHPAAQNVVSVCAAKNSPYFTIFVWRRATLGSCQGVAMERTLVYEMPEHRSIDIDTAFDFLLAETVAARFDWHSGELLPVAVS